MEGARTINQLLSPLDHHTPAFKRSQKTTDRRKTVSFTWSAFCTATDKMTCGIALDERNRGSALIPNVQSVHDGRIRHLSSCASNPDSLLHRQIWNRLWWDWPVPKVSLTCSTAGCGHQCSGCLDSRASSDRRGTLRCLLARCEHARKHMSLHLRLQSFFLNHFPLQPAHLCHFAHQRACTDSSLRVAPRAEDCVEVSQ